MKTDKILKGSVTEASDATGVVPVNHLLPRPPRMSAAKDSPQLDGPYSHFALDGKRSLSATVGVEGGVTAAATLHLQVTNDTDPEDSGAHWHTVDSSGSMGDGNTDHLHAEDIAARFGRLTWTAGANDPSIRATIYVS